MNWIVCPSCEEEFKIISDTTTVPLYCPFCAEDIEHEEDDEEDEWD